MSDRPLVILVGVGSAPYRGYLLRMVARSARVWLLSENRLTWEAPYVVGHSTVDTHDGAALVAAARLVAGSRQVDGVLCWDELKMRHTACIAADLGLPGVGPKVIDRCRDKHLTREALTAAGVPQPQSVVARTPGEAAAAARGIGYPVVLKPRSLGASMGVTLVERPDELAAAFAHTSATRVPEVPHDDRGILVEEYLDGPEVSVDCACTDGRVVPMFVAHKQSGFPPYFEEVGHVVDGADPLLSDPALQAVLTAAHCAVGFDSGVTHVELRRTSAGWSVIEINCRLGGDLIPYLGQLATGIDAGGIAATIACGGMPQVERVGPQVAAVRFLYPPAPTTVLEIRIDTERLPSQVALAMALAEPGEQLTPPPAGHVWGRYAAVAVVDDSLDGCVAALETAATAVRLHCDDEMPTL